MPGAGLVARYSPFERGGHAHGSGSNRRSAAFLRSHLASHGYVVAALDHSEVIAPELAGRADETAAERAARIGSIIASRVPDVRFLLDFLLGGGVAAAASDGVVRLDFDRNAIGLVGHSFGGWTVQDPRAMALPGEAAWIPAAMRPMSELCSGEQAHLFVRGLTLAHLDAALNRSQAAEEFLALHAEAELAARGVEAAVGDPRTGRAR